MRDRRSAAAEGKRKDQDHQFDCSVYCLIFPFPWVNKSASSLGYHSFLFP